MTDYEKLISAGARDHCLGTCKTCEYEKYPYPKCVINLAIANLVEKIVELRAVKKERDAAVADLHHDDACKICKYYIEPHDKGCNCECLTCEFVCTCDLCHGEDRWEWRGVQEDKANE